MCKWWCNKYLLLCIGINLLIKVKVILLDVEVIQDVVVVISRRNVVILVIDLWKKG